MSDADLKALEDVACPGAGACGGQYTANTMSTVMEMIGLSPMGMNSVPAKRPAQGRRFRRLWQTDPGRSKSRHFARKTF